MSNANIHHGNTTILRDEVTAGREEEFMRTFVSRYNLPKKIAAARKRQAVKVSVPLETLDKLIARVEQARAKGTRSVSVGTDNLVGLLAEAGVAA